MNSIHNGTAICFYFILIFILLFPTLAFAQETSPSFMNSFMDQPWYVITSEVIAVMSGLAATLPERWTQKKDGSTRTWFKWFYHTVEFLAVNIFHAKSKG